MKPAAQTYRKYDDEEKVRVMSLYRSLGNNAYQAARIAGVPRTTVHRWIQELGADYGVTAVAERDTEREPAAPAVTDEPMTASESRPSILAALMKLDRIRHAYLDRLVLPDVVNRASARDASSIVRDAQAQIQLLTGQPTGRREVTVRYVQPGALRDAARAEHLRIAEQRSTRKIQSGD